MTELETPDIVIARDFCGFCWEIVVQCRPQRIYSSSCIIAGGTLAGLKSFLGCLVGGVCEIFVIGLGFMIEDLQHGASFSAPIVATGAIRY